ncbi:MAG: DUF4258 domain-containing protein [Candidatus Firestonebacteria bacterium]|nr:DUF4258 domain-containing protein [Candidatus Firestonebacteria bacterium]
MNIDILKFIKLCVNKRKIYWTYHVNMRLKGRSISREAILFSVNTYEIIEDYPKDKYLPSCLIYAKYKEEIIHIHIAIDLENDYIRIITSYKPTLDKWEEDLKTRRKR